MYTCFKYALRGHCHTAIISILFQCTHALSGTGKLDGRIGITLGDPSGIGPEIVAKALFDGEMPKHEYVLYGNWNNFQETWKKISGKDEVFQNVQFVDVPGENIQPGMVSIESGRVAMESIKLATEWALDGKIKALCTAPINKEAILLAGSSYKDHTEMLASLTNSPEVLTVFEVGSLRILFLTKHVPLKVACELVTKERVYKYILLAEKTLNSMGIKSKKIAVAGLNPHSGENGHLGMEELDEIVPAIEKARTTLDVSGPFPADSVFYHASCGKYDIVLAMYHDQGHIASKMFSFYKTVSISLGLPFLRTSVDHGTAFDIAGKGIANPTSMVEAIRKCVIYGDVYKWS